MLGGASHGPATKQAFHLSSLRKLDPRTLHPGIGGMSTADGKIMKVTDQIKNMKTSGVRGSGCAASVRVMPPATRLALSFPPQVRYSATRWGYILKGFAWLCRGSGKQLTVRFMRTPVEVVVSGELGSVIGVRLEKTRLQQEGNRQVAVATGEFETIEVIMWDYCCFWN